MDEPIAADGRGRRSHRAHQRPGRRHAVQVRLSDEEKRLVDAAADRAELTPSGYVARVAVAAAEAQTVAGTMGEELRLLQRELFAARRALNVLGSNVNQAAAARNASGVLPSWAAQAVRACVDTVRRVDEVTARIDRRLR
jgi:uncharacterized protein (DUF1778 family)